VSPLTARRCRADKVIHLWRLDETAAPAQQKEPQQTPAGTGAAAPAEEEDRITNVEPWVRATTLRCAAPISLSVSRT
jgi:hypothetical protein